MFAKKATFNFVDYRSIDAKATKQSLEDYLMSGAKEGKWDEKSAKEYLLAVVGAAANEGKPLKEGVGATKPIKSFKVTALAKLFTSIGFPVKKVEAYDNVNAGPTLSIEFAKPLNDENDFTKAYEDFQYTGGVGAMLPNIESAYHKGGNKWEFQMEM